MCIELTTKAHGIGGLVAWSGTDGPFSSPHLVSDPRYGRLDGLELLLESARSLNGQPLAGADIGLLNPLQLGDDITTVHHVLLRVPLLVMGRVCA